ncbi:MAG: Hypothetical protein AJITA_00953 [Acetilactobacillus jinshanensis]
MDQHQFYYQPSPIFSTIDWCWTFIVLLTGIIFWLEVTHFQWITIIFFIAFFIVGGLELINRKFWIANNVKTFSVHELVPNLFHSLTLKIQGRLGA